LEALSIRYREMLVAFALPRKIGKPCAGAIVISIELCVSEADELLSDDEAADDAVLFVPDIAAPTGRPFLDCQLSIKVLGG
jgi:hypothetical protein